MDRRVASLDTVHSIEDGDLHHRHDPRHRLVAGTSDQPCPKRSPVPIGDIVGSRGGGHNGRCRGPKYDNRRRVTDTTIHNGRDHATPPYFVRRTSASESVPSLVMRNDTGGVPWAPPNRKRLSTFLTSIR